MKFIELEAFLTIRQIIKIVKAMYDQGLDAVCLPLLGSQDKLMCVQISIELVLRSDQMDMNNSIK